jgi:beta-glucosidase
MNNFDRFRYQPVSPLGKNGRLITGCKEHQELSKRIAAEGTVLLKNDGLLPLKKGSRICPFGSGFSSFLPGGGGSAWVEDQSVVLLGDELRNRHNNGDLRVFTPLLDFYDQSRKPFGDLSNPKVYLEENPATMPIVDEKLYQEAIAFGGVALFCITRFSGESNHYDRGSGKGDFRLSEQEEALFNRLCEDFDRVLVILNTCGPVETKRYRENPKVGAVLYPMYSGGRAGEVLCDLILGERYPSGHLQDSFADEMLDYPGMETFEAFTDHEDYSEDIFTGYRYFETFAPEKTPYPFGFGLSYTEFEVAFEKATRKGNKITATINVKNVGNRVGKEIIQLYLSAPNGKLGKPKKVLVAFQKTRELHPQGAAKIHLSFNLCDFASFDDKGEIEKSAFVLEKGEYSVLMGTNVQNTTPIYTFTKKKDEICRKCKSLMAPSLLNSRLTAFGSYEPLPKPIKQDIAAPVYSTNAEPESISFVAALEQNKLDGFLAGLSNEKLFDLLHGHPILNASDTSGIGASLSLEIPDRGIPLVPTADGGSGYRIKYGLGMSATFFPCPTVLAQSWNPLLAEKMGKAGALELKENNVGIWLCPGMNLHRNPFCGRSFEYFSEDPFVSGVFAAAFVKGVQSQKVAATIKHFACNNKENNRKYCDSRVSERALRENYLKGFEIAIKKSKPLILMTSYNLVNGVRSSKNVEMILGILREEWGYEGLVITDWNAHCSKIDEELLSGSNVKMPFAITESSEPFDLKEALNSGTISRENLLYSAKKVLEFLSKLK